MTWRKILCPTDFSPASRDALRVAVELAGYFTGEVALLHVFSPPDRRLPESIELGPTAALRRRFDEVGRQLQSWVELARADGGAPVTAHARAGATAVIIAHFAKEHGCDAIVMGSDASGLLEHLVLGSVAGAVIHLANCPVVSVPVRD